MKIHLNQAELFEIAEVGQKQKLQEWLHENGKQQKAVTLGKTDISLVDLWQKYKEYTQTSDNSLEYLVHQYTNSSEFKAKPTAREMLRALNCLLNTP